jgi:hypothetical protein
MDELLNLSHEQLLDKANEAAKNGDIMFFEKIINLELKEKLNPSFQPFNITYNLFSIACEHNQIGILKYFINSTNWSDSFNNFFILSENAREVCRDGNIDIIKYLFNEPKIKDKNSLYDFILYNASCFDRLDIVEYILENFSSNPSIQMSIMNGQMLNSACEYGNLNILQYYFNSPKFINHSHREIHKEDLFKIALNGQNMEILQYLIIDLELKKNKVIKEALVKKGNDEVEKLFTIRDLKKSLEENLPKDDNRNSKKPKL